MPPDPGSVRRFARFTALVAVLVFAAPAQGDPGWTPPFAVGFDATQVAMSPDGTTAYTGLAMVGGSQRVVVQVRPPGGVLGPIQPLSAPGATNLAYPALAAGPDGRFAMAWSESGLLETAEMLPGSQTFGDIVAMPAAPDQTDGGVAIAVTKAGEALVLWTSGQVFATTHNALLRAGVRPVVGGPTDQIIAQVAETNSESTLFTELRVAAADSGAAIAGWQHIRSAGPNTTTDAQVAMREPGQPFGAVVTLDSGTRNGGDTSRFADPPKVAMTPSGEAGVAWGFREFTPAGDTYSVRFRSGTPTAGLGAVQQPSDAGGLHPFARSVAFAADGRALVGWTADVSGVPRPQVAFRPPGGDVFTKVQTVTMTGQPAFSLDLSASASGATLLLMTTNDGAADRLESATSPPGGLFGAPVPAGTPAPGGIVDRGIANTPMGDGVAIWRWFDGNSYVTNAAGYDVSGPTFSSVQIPAAGATGSPLAFAATATDLWGPVTIGWSFGDGGTGTGTATQHTYATPGSRPVVVTATDAVGNATSTTNAVAIASGPPGGGGRDTRPPAISRFALTRSVFAPTSRPARAARKVPHGTSFRLTLSEAATVVITISRQAAGLRSAKRCVRSTAKLRRAGRKRCVRLLAAGSLKRSLTGGAATVPFDGWVGGHALKAAHYRAGVVATDAAGNHASHAPLTFRIVRAR